MPTNEKAAQPKIEMPSLERIQQELGNAKSIDDFFGKDGIFARLFATTLEQMLEGELTAQLTREGHPHTLQGPDQPTAQRRVAEA